MADNRTLPQMKTALRQSQQSLLDILARADDDMLYQRIIKDEWSLAENLAHISEARSYFTVECQKVLAQPGITVGRLISDAGRVQNVQDHGHDARELLHQKLLRSHEQVMQLLEQMNENDLQQPLSHVRLGPQTLGEFIDHFIVDHDRDHVRQSMVLLG